MYFRERLPEQPIKVRDPPLHRSSSVSAILHGGNGPTSNHYIDALQRFRRDHAVADKEQRQRKHEQKMRSYEKRRNHYMDRQNKIKNFQEENLNRLLQKQRHSQMLHEQGAKKTAHTYSIPVNPINSKYEENDRGRYQAHVDEEKVLNRLVRAHHLTTCGTSGYNLINGQSSHTVDDLVPNNSHEMFEQKLSKYYSQFRLDPSENPKKMPDMLAK